MIIVKDMGGSDGLLRIKVSLMPSPSIHIIDTIILSHVFSLLLTMITFEKSSQIILFLLLTYHINNFQVTIRKYNRIGWICYW